MIPFTFPATMEEFMAYQEQLINRPLSEVERDHGGMASDHQ